MLINFSTQAGTVTVNFSENRHGLSLEHIENNSLGFTSSINNLLFENIYSEYGNFSFLSYPNSAISSDVGKPQIPVYSELIEIPHLAEIKVIIIDYEVQEIALSDLNVYPIFPVQESYSKSTAPEDVVFNIDNDFYTTDAYDDFELITTEIFSAMRGVRIGRVEVRPFSYNPVKNILKIYNNLQFEVKFLNADHEATVREKQIYYSERFEPLFRNKIINYSSFSQRDHLTDYSSPIKYVIVSDPYFQSTLQDFVSWKTKKGFDVIEAYTDEIGQSNTEIKEYLQSLYDAATIEDPAPLYLLIIGDHSGDYSIPAFFSTATTPSSNHITDLYYACFGGEEDFLPDMYYGRISATTQQQLQNALDKIIPYEKYEFPDDSFLNSAMLIAGTDANWANSHGDATINYAIDNYYNYQAGYEDVFGYYYSLENAPHHYMFTQNNSINASLSVRSKINQGVGFANYTAHCNWDRWSDPLVQNSDVTQFTNQDKYPFMIGNCCQSMRFNMDDALGEVLLYTENAGAVAYIGASNNSYWNEDVFWGIGLTSLNITQSNVTNHDYSNTGLGIYDGIWHTHGEDYEDWYYSGSQIIFRGNAEVLASTSTYKKYYWEIYHLSGDPSLVPYKTKPEMLQMSYEIPEAGDTILTVTTEPYAYIAVSENGNLLDAKWSGNGNTVNLSISDISDTVINIVGTKQNRAPAIDTGIIILSPDPPQAYFSADITSGCNEISVQFFDNSTNNPDSWLWDFGNGMISFLQNPIVDYNEIGQYSVSLTVSNEYGSSQTSVENYISVTEMPLIELSMTSEDYWGANNGTATVSVSSEGSYTIEWCNQLTDYTIENLSAGNYCVTVSTSENCYATNCIEVEYGESEYAPVADFYYDIIYACDSLVIQFYDNSLNNPESTEWNFGDGNFSNEQNPVHFFYDPGQYQVTLTAYNQYGEDSTFSVITVNNTLEIFTEVVSASSENSADGSASAFVFGGYPPYHISWSNGETGNMIENLLPGAYSVAVVDYYGCIDTHAFIIDQLTGIEENNVFFSIFPNPVDDRLFVKFEKHPAKEIIIYDTNGRILKKKTIISLKQKINMTEFAGGIYFIKLRYENSYYFKKIILK